MKNAPFRLESLQFPLRDGKVPRLTPTLMELNKQTIVAALAILIIGGSLTSILYHKFHKPPVEDHSADAYQGMGQAVAEEAAAALGGKGTVVVIGATPSAAQPFERGAAAKPGVALKPVAATGKIGSHEELDALIKSGNGDGAVVFEDAVDLQKLLQSPPGIAPTTTLVTGDWGAARELIEKKIIRVAIIPRMHPPASSEPPKTPREIFDNRYEVIDASSLGSLPARK